MLTHVTVQHLDWMVTFLTITIKMTMSMTIFNDNILSVYYPYTFEQ